MKHADERPYANPEAAARKLVEIATSVEAVQDGRIYIERINAPFFVQAEGQWQRVRRRAQTRDRARLAPAARERDLRALAKLGRWLTHSIDQVKEQPAREKRAETNSQIRQCQAHRYSLRDATVSLSWRSVGDNERQLRWPHSLALNSQILRLSCHSSTS